MGRTAVTAGSYGALEDALRSEIALIRSRDRFARIDVLVGSNLLGLSLKRRLAARLGGLFNIHFLTFVDLIAHIEAVSGAGTIDSPPALAEVLAAEETLSTGAPRALGGVAVSQGLVGALLATFDDLAEGGCTVPLARSIARGAGSALSERGREILSLYARYRERLEGLGADVHARFRRAVDRCEARLFETPLLVYGFYDFNETQWRLIEAVASGTGVTIFVPWSEGASHRFAERAIRRIERGGFSRVRADGGVADLPHRRETIILAALGVEDEVRGIVRKILSLAGGGVRFGEIGVLLPTVDPYLPLFREAFAEAGVPYFARQRGGLDVRSPLRAAVRLLELSGGRIDRRDLVEFLAAAPLAASVAGDGEGGAIALWTRRSAEAGLVGAEGWIEENRRWLRLLEARSEAHGGELPDTCTSAPPSPREEARRLTEAARLVGRLLERIHTAREAFAAEATWRSHTRQFISLIRDLLESSEEIERYCETIERLGELDRLSSPATYRSFCRLAEETAERMTTSHGRFSGAGVNLLTIGDARGIPFRAVFIPGLIERVLPGIVRQDPLLGDEERAALEGAAVGRISLSRRTDRASEEELIFRLAAGSAGEILVCSYPRYDAQTGKELVPSSYLRFVAGPSAGGTGRRAAARRRLSADGAEDALDTAVSAAEYDLLQASRVRRGTGLIPVNAFFERGVELVKARWGTKRFTSFDGVFSSPAALRALGELLEERGRSFSPTSMETYAACPFAYYLRSVLGLETLEEPERVIAITPLQRGSIVHDVLARLYGAFGERGLLPFDPARRLEIAAVTAEVTEEILGAYPKREPVGLPLFWELERRAIADSIGELVAEEIGEALAYTPTHFEASFGDARGGMEVTLAATRGRVRFRGRIDRIDLGEGTKFRVIDYKTGKLEGFKDRALLGGTALQLPIYLLAASRMLDRPVAAGIAQYRRVGRVRGKRFVTYGGERWDEDEPRLAAIVDTITGGIERGLFFAVPSETGCRYCAVRSACPSGTDRLFAEKALGDERCRDFLALREVSE